MVTITATGNQSDPAAPSRSNHSATHSRRLECVGYSRGVSCHRSGGWHISNHHASRTDSRPIPDLHASKHNAVGADQNVVTKPWDFVTPAASQGDALANRTPLTDYDVWMDDDPKTIVREPCTRADLGLRHDVARIHYAQVAMDQPAKRL